MTTTNNLALTLYSLASVNFYDREYFESAFKLFTDSDSIPSIKDLGYIVQACAILRRNEYNDFLSRWFEESANSRNIFDKTGVNIDNEFSIAQIMQGLAYLGVEVNDQVKEQMKHYCRNLVIEMTAQHLKVIPSIVWSLL